MKSISASDSPKMIIASARVTRILGLTIALLLLFVGINTQFLFLAPAEDNLIDQDVPPLPLLPPKTNLSSPMILPPSSTINGENYYGYVVLVVSKAGEASRRALIRERYFGMRHNLVPCMEFNTDVYYKFYIHGGPPQEPWQRQLYEAERMEWNDMIEAPQGKPFGQEALLEWAAQELSVTYDYLIIQDINTFIHLPIIKRELDAGVIGEDTDTPYVINSDQPLNLIWGSFTGRSTDAKAVIIGSTAVDLLLINRGQQFRLQNRTPYFLTNMYRYYRAMSARLKDEIDARLGPEEAAEQQALLIPAFVQQENMMRWENNVESVHTEDWIVTDVIQDSEFAELATWTQVRSISVCVHHRSSSYYYQQLAIATSSFISYDEISRNDNVVNDGCSRELSRASVDNKRAYAIQQGYAFVARSMEYAYQDVKNRAAAWGTIDILEKILPKYKWVLWLDPKAIITDIDRSILEDLPDDIDFFFIDDGIFLIRNAVWSRRFLREVQKVQAEHPITALKQIMALQSNQNHILIVNEDSRSLWPVQQYIDCHNDAFQDYLLGHHKQSDVVEQQA
ncbi:hypothetical protein BX666DRAFT_1929557 [Dichotomocladium elegans]|nr:hypothetical protein BX666DRAFT_1929557 [Dichotomocladium elegans]